MPRKNKKVTETYIPVKLNGHENQFFLLRLNLASRSTTC